MMNTFMSQSNEKHCDISALSLGYDDDLELSPEVPEPLILQHRNLHLGCLY